MVHCSLCCYDCDDFNFDYLCSSLGVAFLSRLYFKPRGKNEYLESYRWYRFD
jgi:hypothetical protein